MAMDMGVAKGMMTIIQNGVKMTMAEVTAMLGGMRTDQKNVVRVAASQKKGNRSLRANDRRLVAGN